MKTQAEIDEVPGRNVEQVTQKIADERERIRAKVLPEVEAEFRDLEARQARDTAERNAILEVSREKQKRAQVQSQPVTATNDRTEGVTPRRGTMQNSSSRPTGSDGGAESGNNPGGSVATTMPGPAKPARKQSSRDKAIAKVTNGAKPTKGSTAAKPAGKPAEDERPSKPTSGLVYIRHMRSPRDAYILIKNVSVFGKESNWATKEEFKSAEAATEWAKKNGLRVLNAK